MAVACTGIAWGGHAVWAGCPTHPAAFPTATAFTWAGLARLTRSHRGFGETFTALATAQLGLHAVFTALPAAHDSHSAAPGAISATLDLSPAMLGGHLTAALLAALLLAHGESALLRLLALARDALPAPLHPRAPVAAPDRTPALQRTDHPRAHPLHHPRPRGPPLHRRTHPARFPATSGTTTDKPLERSTMTPTTAPRRATALLVSLATTGALGTALAPAALAHNTLVGSTPESGATLDTTPEEVELTFNDEIGDGNNAIAVSGPDGDDRTDGDVTIEGDTATTQLQPLEESGEYTVSYRIVSADGHLLEEELAFSLSDSAVDDQSPDSGADNAEETGSGDADGNSDDQTPAGGGDTTNPMAAFGPVGAVVAAIAVAAILVIVLVRIRANSRGRGGDES